MRKEYMELLNKNYEKSNYSFNKESVVDLKTRPQTANIKKNENKEYEDIINEINKFKYSEINRKNSLLSSSSEDGEENNDSDKEIDDLLRKSMSNLNSLKTEIK